MARIRTIKPEFFTSEDIVALSPLARLLYIAIWCEADKEGRLVWKPATFRLRYFPADNCDIRALCDELVSAGLVVLYGHGLAHIPGFARHQHVNPRESKSVLPEPPTHIERTPSHIPKDIREEVMERDGGKCVRCGSDDHLQLDHILPQSCGGPHMAENLRVLCRSCNAGRPVSGDALEEDLAKDGFSYKTLRVKFGIDASILDLHAQGGREGKGREGITVPDGTDAADAPAPVAAKPPKTPKTPEDMAKAELWRASVSVLEQGGCQKSQCRTFMGKLAQDYPFDVLQKAVASAVSEQPADAREYLKATCQRLQGERKDPVTVPSAAPVETAAYIAAQDAAKQAASSPETIAAREAAMAKIRGAVKTMEPAA